MALTDAEFWWLRGLIDAHGDEGAATKLGLTVRELCEVQWPGEDERLVGRVRGRLQTRRC